MEISQLGPNHLSVCDCCGVLLHNQLTDIREAMDALHEGLKAHIEMTPKCKAYYNALRSSLDDLCGSCPDFRDRLSREEFIMKYKLPTRELL